MIALGGALVFLITLVFAVGFLFHWRTVYRTTSLSQNRIHPETFTLKSKVGQDMWDLSLQSYDHKKGES